jgi:hypothetical protein
MPMSAREVAEATVPKKSARRVKPRTPDEDLRIYGPPEFREWLHAQPCAVCGWQGKPEQMQQCHARTGGTGYKGPWTETFPGCGPHWVRPNGIGIKFDLLIEGCHKEQGRCGVKTFEMKRDVVLLELAAETQREWLAFSGAAS